LNLCNENELMIGGVTEQAIEAAHKG